MRSKYKLFTENGHTRDKNVNRYSLKIVTQDQNLNHYSLKIFR